MARKKTQKITFTTDRVAKLPPPATGRMYVYDAKTPGLAVAVSSTGGKVFYFYRWQNGRPARVRLGRFPDISIKQARDAAAEQSGKQARGIDLVAERRAARQQTTLDELFNRWLTEHAKHRKRTWADDERQFNKYFDSLRHRRIGSIRVGDVSKWHAAIGEESGKVQANRSKALLATLLNFAVRIELLRDNPCRSVPYFPEQSRERFLLPSEMKRFFSALVAAGEPWHDFFQLCLFTGARRGNVAAMSWGEIDLDRMTWTIPASKTKNNRPAVVALPPPAIAIIRNRLAWTAGQPWVFPANSASGHISDPRKAWERVRTASGLTDLRMHDLRRSMGSWQAAAGASLAIIGASLGHADLKSTQTYARLQTDVIQASVAKAADAMLEAAGMLTLDVDVKGGENGMVQE